MAEQENAVKNVPLNSEEESTSKLPYYLENFNWIVKNVCSEPEFQRLFETEAAFRVDALSRFDSLPLNAQKLYVRLFLRKHVFLPRHRIKYEDEFGGEGIVSGLLAVLAEAEFIDDQLSGSSLHTTVEMLNLPQLREVCKIFKTGNGTSSKKELLPLLLKKCRDQRTPFGKPLSEIVRQKAVAVLGKVYRLEEARRSLFMRMFTFFRLSVNYNSLVGQNPIYGLLQMNLGNTKYPVVSIISSIPLFKSFEQFIQFESAQQCLDEICLAWEEKNIMQAGSIYETALPVWQDIINDKEATEETASLPYYLRKFRAGYCYTKVVEQGLEYLERMGKIGQAMDGYEELLNQTVYVPHHRGEWYNRLSILRMRKDKDICAAAKVLLRGIDDPDVRPYHKLELFLRLKRMFKRLEDCILQEEKFLEMKLRFAYKCANENYINGRRCPTANKMGKSVFIGEEDDVFVSSVEELALSHYRKNGYSEGFHVEGSLITSLYGILFWDVIYSQGIPGAFRSKFQSAPLDLGCPSFFISRRDSIQERCEWIRRSLPADLLQSVAEIWNQHSGKQCVVNWDYFSSLDQLTSLGHCFTPNQLADICKRFATDFGAVRAGFPDLTVWNPQDRKVKFVEVKGPNDKLSFKQILWIDFLLDINVPVEVCHVQATGSKRKLSVVEKSDCDKQDIDVIVID